MATDLERIEAWVSSAVAHHGLAAEDAERMLEDARMGEEIQRELLGLVKRMEAGESVSWADAFAAISGVGRRHGHEYGLPIPHIGGGRNLVLARRAPLRSQAALRSAARTALEGELGLAGVRIRNSWRQLGDREICVVEDTDGKPRSMVGLYAGSRLRRMFADLDARHESIHLTAKAEVRALRSLRRRTTEAQFRTYMLANAFVERSRRSDIFYVFRKGLPTLALTFHGGGRKLSPSLDGEPEGRVIAALCLHPLGYYEGSFCGVMAPTDEVIAHLAMMRGDERRYWARSGQWAASDRRSGL